jgi:hypothetical protein
MKHFINWKIFFVLLGLAMTSIICVFPYVLSIQGELLSKIGQPIGVIFIAQLVQSLILFFVVIFLGLFFTKKINFQLPLIESIVEKRDYKVVLKNILGKSVLIGAFTAIIIYVLDTFFTTKGAVISTHQSYAPVWQKLLAAVYGGTTEEILMRLFLMAFFIWIGMKLFKQKEPSKIGIIIVIFLVAIIFGLGHLPITASITKITPIVVARAIILNGIGGIVFGWLFWKNGLESAMIAHFTADIFLLTLLPLLF